MPKHRYDDIEHGSSDWSKNGEQYTILNNKKGIIILILILFKIQGKYLGLLSFVHTCVYGHLFYNREL